MKSAQSWKVMMANIPAEGCSNYFQIKIRYHRVRRFSSRLLQTGLDSFFLFRDSAQSNIQIPLY